mmetsp:Transcript_16328/g.48947  ORF Transcript_16328/g.48947 Transcript_16328/m.48947 type:complete len:467 (-) Transcript_16328:785-2185(-)
MEQGQLYVELLGDLDQGLLHLVQPPGGGNATGVLAAVGVAHHDLLHAIDVLQVPVAPQQRLHGVRAVVQVVQRLEQRRHPHVVRDAHLSLQQHHCQHVGRGAGHANDVSAHAVRRQLSDDLEGVDHVRHLTSQLQPCRHEGPLAVELCHQEFLALLLVPLQVAAQAQEGSDGIDGRCVLAALLPDVQGHQAHAEGRHLADDVQDAGLGNILVAAVDEGLVDEGERLQELLLGGVRLSVVLQVLLHVHVGVHHAVVQHLPSVVELVSHFREDHTVRLADRQDMPELGIVLALTLLRDHGSVRCLPRHDAGCQRPGLVRAAPHGQFVHELLHGLEVQIGGRQPRRDDHVPRGGRRHVRVAVTVATHPAAKLEQAVVQRQRGLPNVLQRRVDAPQETRQALEDSLVEVRQPLPHLILGAGLGAPDLISAPGRLDLGADRLQALRLLVRGHAAVVQLVQVVPHAAVLLQQ